MTAWSATRWDGCCFCSDAIPRRAPSWNGCCALIRRICRHTITSCSVCGLWVTRRAPRAITACTGASRPMNPPRSLPAWHDSATRVPTTKANQCTSTIPSRCQRDDAAPCLCSLLGQPHVLQASVHPVVGHRLVVAYFGRPHLAAGPGQARQPPGLPDQLFLQLFSQVDAFLFIEFDFL